MDFSKNEIKKFKETIDDMIDINLQNAGITKYISAIVYAKNNDGTYNLYIPPDTSNIISNIYNKTGETLNIGDSVELCTKNGSVNNCWIAVKHGTSVEPSPTPTFEFPVGSVVITDTNTTPTYTGTWTLIDKEFTPMYVYSDDTTYITRTNLSTANIRIRRGGHSINMTFQIKPSTTLSDTEVELGILKLPAMGLTEKMGVNAITAFCDADNTFVMMQVAEASDGNCVIKSVDAQPSSTSGDTIQFDLTVVAANITKMSDSECNKFYWKRTA